MSPLVALVALLALVVVATALGVLQRGRAGRVRRGSGATLVQFSTPTCAQCPGTARLLRDVAEQHPGVVHLEVDLTRHPEVADRFGVLQTPTTWAHAPRFRRAAERRRAGRGPRGIVDAGRCVRARIGGAPRPDDLDRELQTVLGGTRAR